MFGGLGFWELLIILIVIFLIVVLPIYLILKIVKKFGQNNKSDDHSEPLRKLELLKKDANQKFTYGRCGS